MNNMAIGKWNFKTHEYEPYELPAGAKLFSEDMNEIVSCANCSKEMTYGAGYTSRKIHNRVGLAFPVCEVCYEFEIKEEVEAKKRSAPKGLEEA